MAEPPVEPGVKVTVAAVLPGEAEGDVGAEGMVNGVPVAAFEAADDPTPFTAKTSKE